MKRIIRNFLIIAVALGSAEAFGVEIIPDVV